MPWQQTLAIAKNRPIFLIAERAAFENQCVGLLTFNGQVAELNLFLRRGSGLRCKQPSSSTQSEQQCPQRLMKKGQIAKASRHERDT
jgi:hypothetical protein